MNLFLIWISFTIIISFTKLNNSRFIIVNLIMLYITYIYNVKKFTMLSLNNVILISFIPNSLVLYILYKCNKFLWIKPYNYETFLLIVFYFLICIFLKINYSITNQNSSDKS